MPYVIQGFFGFILLALNTQRDTLVALLFTPLWFIVGGIGYMARPRNLQHASCARCIAKVRDEL